MAAKTAAGKPNGASNSSKSSGKADGRATAGRASGLVWLIVSALFAVVVAVAFNLLELQPSAGSTDAPSGGSGVEQASAGTVIGREPAVVELMPASDREKYEVQHAEDLPFVRLLGGPPLNERRERPMGARFYNFYRFHLDKYWDDGSEKGVFSGKLRAFGQTATNTYTGHRFKFYREGTDELIETLTMKEDEHFMLLGPPDYDAKTRKTEMYRNALKEQEFIKDYFARTGRPWLSHYPPHKPVLPFWPTDFVGQLHKVYSPVGYFTSETEQSADPVELKLRVVSTKPRVLLIEDLLSDFEIEHIVSLGLSVVRRSSVGTAGDGFESDTRTSDNGWISRHRTPIMDTIYKRFGDALNMTEDQMREGHGGNLEQLQFVRYKEGQKYEPHHDFGATGKPNQRFSTLFIYLKTPEEGGATSFPKAVPNGIKVKPPPGSAALFYSMDEDGNGDDLSLHSGMTVDKGLKLGCNLWTWTPSYD